MSKTAPRGRLAGLHAKITDVLTEALECIGASDEDGEKAEITSEDLALLRLTTAFLKDNDVTCDDEETGEKDAKMQRLAEMRQKRTVASTPMDVAH